MYVQKPLSPEESWLFLCLLLIVSTLWRLNPPGIHVDTCAISLLNSTLGSGMSRRTPSSKPVLIPPPSHLALLSTLAVHPLHTTRAENARLREVSSVALSYLRRLLSVSGPVNAGFRTAFQFHSSPRRGRRPGLANAGSDSDASDGDGEHGARDRPRGRMANQSSIWSRGQDLWMTVGWAFNTSALHPDRWRYWKVWLHFMLDVLDADWAERERQDEVAHETNGGEGDAPTASRRESMIAMYMGLQDGAGQAAHKRIIKALLADGSPLSSSSFPAVFEKELRGPRRTSKKRKRDQVLDLENDKYGDYLDDDSISSGVSEPPTPPKPRGQRRKSTLLGTSESGPAESVGLRLRFFQLISAATCALGKEMEVCRLYEELALGIKGLRLDMFALHVTQKENPLPAEAHVSIIRDLFHLLLPPRYKDPRKVDPGGHAEARLTMRMLEDCYVSWPANTVALEDNAKLSLLVESAIQLLWLNDAIDYTESFGAACETGIQSREAKARKRRTGKIRAESDDVVAQEILHSSGQRIRVLLDELKSTTPL